MAGIPVRDLVLTLRRAAGLEVCEDAASSEAKETAAVEPSPVPQWLRDGTVVESFDADVMLAAGQVPLGPVVRRARTLRAQELVRVVSSFRPVPLVDKLVELGHPVHVAASDSETGGFSTYIASSSSSAN